MSQSESNPHQVKHALPVVGERPGQVPVFDCHVILTPPGEASKNYRGVVSKLPEVTAEGPTERDVLMKIVGSFKQKLTQYTNDEQPIPWAETPVARGPGDVERWIPVHL